MVPWLAALLDAVPVAVREADEADVEEDDAELELLDAEDEEDELELLDDDSLDATEASELELPPDEPGLSANIAKATMAARTAMAAIMKTTIPPPPRLGVGSKFFTLRGAVAGPLADRTV